MERLDVRLDAQSAQAGGANEALINGWIKAYDDDAVSSLHLPMFCDAFPPSPFTKLGVIGWVPTVELTVHVRATPANGWIQGQFETKDLRNGRMIENGKLWDSRGVLVAQSRQIGLVTQG